MAEAKPYKLSRKDLREPDEFQVRTGQAVEWLREHQTAVVGAASAILALVAVVLGMGWYSSRRAAEATTRLQAAQALFDARQFAEAATRFEAVASEYGSTPAGQLATLYRARALAAQPDPAAAATAYGEYLAGSPPTEYLRQDALIALGRAHEAANDAAAAKDAYRKAADVAGPFRTPAQLALARLEDAAGNTDAARALWVELLKAPDLDAESRRLIVGRLPADAVPTTDGAGNGAADR